MPQLIARHNPKAFKTLPLSVEANHDGLTYQALGQPLNFSEMLERRKPIEIDDAQHFSARLANLGVSVRLTLNWQGQDHWLLVRQRRPDRGDVVLKLISGYIPTHELALPLLTAVQEVAEECLIETPRGWLAGRFADTWLPTPYAPALPYREDVAFRLTPRSGAARPVRCGSLALLERPRAYVHTPTASLQLVYDLLLELPKECKAPSLFHVDEKIENGQLLARLARQRPDLYLVALDDGKPTGELYTLSAGQRLPVSTRGLWLSESFARQDGWLVHDSRVRWRDWLERMVPQSALQRA